ncbi:MAG: carbohydrate kinase family protein [Bacilli bacterium]|nr:carbohydrate kinase family protein [Bacilli bacterium]
MGKILVIGGANIDIIGYLKAPMINKDSNVGEVAMSYGGVGRNIVENLARLKTDVTFLTSIGQDAYSKSMEEELLSLGVHLYTPENQSSSYYIAMIGPDHDMEVALCDSRATDVITAEYLANYDALIRKFTWVVIDGNLSKETIDYFFTHYPHHKIIVDAISTAKALKFLPYLDKITCFKANIYEAQAIFGQVASAEMLIKEAVKRQIPFMIITQGSKPIIYCYHGEVYSIEVPIRQDIVNATGAGDAFLSGVTYELLKGHNNHQAMIALGKKMASMTLLSLKATHPQIIKVLEEDK